MVTLASADLAPAPERGRGGVRPKWAAATGAVLLAGVGLRVALDPGGVGDRSAAVMIALVGLSTWMTALVLGRPRTAFWVTLGAVALLNVAALPPRAPTEYDDRQAFYRTDQVLAAQVPIAAGSLDAQPSPALAVLVEPRFSGAQPSFGLAGEVGGTSLAWACVFRHGIQRLVLPVPRTTLGSAAAVAVQLHLTGAPSRESDYLLVYASSARGGFLVSLVSADAGQGTTLCTST